MDWILCENELPAEPEMKIKTIEDVEEAILFGKIEEYNVTIKDATKSTTLYYAEDGYWYDEVAKDFFITVIAWQPLPPVYIG